MRRHVAYSERCAARLPYARSPSIGLRDHFRRTAQLLGDNYEEDWSEEGEEEEGNEATFETDEALLSLLTEIRKQLVNRDYRALYAVWEVYGDGDEEEDKSERPPVPSTKRAGMKVIEQLRGMLETP